MDDLDRMLRRLVQNIRTGHTEYLSRPFEVAELYQTLIPYRHNRRELAIETNQDYELALCRLLAGERGYLVGDEDMQQAIARELAGPNPNTAIFREFAASRIALSPEAVRRHDHMTSEARSAPTLATPPTPPSRTRPPVDAAPFAPRPMPPRATTRSPSPPTIIPPPPSTVPGGPERPVPSAEDTRSESAAPGNGGTATGCRYCGGTLPAGRRTLFCPHCGQNLTVQRCPACGTELEIGWQFCITCGRGVSAT